MWLSVSEETQVGLNNWLTAEADNHFSVHYKTL